MGLNFYCSECGAPMCSNVNSDGGGVVYIDPCSTCLDKKYDEGYNDGLEEGSE
jgi:hypothetical protein